jgi:hypothetical protein
MRWEDENGECTRIWKVIMAYFKVLSQHLPRGMEGEEEKKNSQECEIWMQIKFGTSHIQVQNVTNTPTCLVMGLQIKRQKFALHFTFPLTTSDSGVRISGDRSKP